MDRIGKHIPLSKRFKKGVDQDTFISFELASSNKSLIEYDINSVVNVEDIFTQERLNSKKYRFSGRLNIITANELSPDAKNYDWDPLFDGPEKETPNNWLLQIVRPTTQDPLFTIETYTEYEEYQQFKVSSKAFQGPQIEYVIGYNSSANSSKLNIFTYHQNNVSIGDYVYLYNPEGTNRYHGIHRVDETNRTTDRYGLILDVNFIDNQPPENMIRVLGASDSDVSFSNPFFAIEFSLTDISGNTCSNCGYAKIKTDGKINLNEFSFIDLRSININGLFKVVSVINTCEFIIEYYYDTIPNNALLRELDGTPSEYYIRHFEVVSVNQYETYKAGFSSNIYPDTLVNELGVSNGTWLFHFNQDIDFIGKSDNRGGEVSEVYLTLVKRSGERTYDWSNVNSGWEHNRRNLAEDNFNIDRISNRVVGGVGTIEKSDIGDKYVGDYVDYNRLEIKETPLINTVFYFFSLVGDSTGEGYYYDPYKKLKLRVYSEDIETAEEDEIIINLPDNHETYPDGSIAWRDLLQIGFLEPGNEGNRGVDYPFVNGAHYFYTNQSYYVRRQTPPQEKLISQDDIITIDLKNIC